MCQDIPDWKYIHDHNKSTTAARNPINATTQYFGHVTLSGLYHNNGLLAEYLHANNGYTALSVLTHATQITPVYPLLDGTLTSTECGS